MTTEDIIKQIREFAEGAEPRDTWSGSWDYDQGYAAGVFTVADELIDLLWDLEQKISAEKMNDYEINLRLAEIAGRDLTDMPDWWHEGGSPEVFVFAGPPEAAAMPTDVMCWSPLTDWSQLGPLMERFAVEPCSDVTGDNWCAKAYVTDMCGPTRFAVSMKRAVCLAIIGAHEDEE